MLLALLLSACEIPDRPETAAGGAVETYFFEYCRLYEQNACERSRAQTCGPRITGPTEYDNEKQCVTWQKWTWSQCPGLADELSKQEELVRACNDELDEFDCREEPWCDPDGDEGFLAGACGDLRALVDEKCAT